MIVTLDGLHLGAGEAHGCADTDADLPIAAFLCASRKAVMDKAAR